MSESARSRVVMREAWPPVAGRPGLTQGRYGAAGNLELVVPAADDGLWVAWFNADPTDTRSGAALRSWSGVLKFARGQRYTTADITQVSAGPDYLEALGRTASGVLRRHVWSPEEGFVDHGAIAVDVASASAVVECADGSMVVAVAGADGAVRLLHAEPTATYPLLTFAERPAGSSGPATDVDAAWHGDHLDLLTVAPDGTAVLECGGSLREASADCTYARIAIASDGRRWLALTGSSGSVGLSAETADGSFAPTGAAAAGAAAAVAAVRLEGRPEYHLLSRNGGSLTHLRYAGSSEPAVARLVEAQVWADPGTSSVHRP